MTTGAGATLRVPKGFSASVETNVVKLQVPGDQVEVYVVELKGDVLADVIQLAWRAVDPGYAGAIDKAVTPPASGGWDALRIENSVVGADGLFAQAVARRKEQTVWVSLVRGTPANIDKRAAQVRSFFGSLDVPGIKEVDLSDVEPKPISASIAELEAFINKAMAATGTPGLSIAIVEGDKVVFSNGYGVREVGGDSPVDADTLMMIGSVSKSVTTFMMATLVDDAKLAWDARVIDVFPTFRLGDQGLAESLLVEQLVCACAGLPRKDVPLILEFEGKGAAEVFGELAQMKPSTGLKETFQYQNHIVAAGGYVAARAFDADASLEAGYERAMRTRVFEPLGMSRTTLDHDQAIAAQNRATPHSYDLHAVHRVVSLEHERFAAFVAPSGGIWSTANDMARYLLTELARGVAPDGSRAVSEANLVHRWQPQVAISADVHYGLGWIVSKKKGLRMVTHGGGTMGFATSASFFPDKKLGVVMIANGTGGHAAERSIRQKLQELWFAQPSKAEKALEFSMSEQDKEFADSAKRSGPPAAEWMKDFIGTYDHPELGKMTISQDSGGYVLDAGAYRTRLLRYDRPDSKRVLMFADPPLAGMELIPLGTAEGTFEMSRAQERYVLKRTAPGRSEQN